MAQSFTLNFTDGIAPATSVEYGTYNITKGTISGYADATLNTTTLTVNSSTSTDLPLTLTADGSATVTITNSSGSPITTGVTFERYVSLLDQTGYTPVSGVIDSTSSATGLYKINFLPYITTAGYDVYFKVSAPGVDTTNFTILMNQKNVTGLTLTMNNAILMNSTLQDAKFTGFPLEGSVNGNPQ